MTKNRMGGTSEWRQELEWERMDQALVEAVCLCVWPIRRRAQTGVVAALPWLFHHSNLAHSGVQQSPKSKKS
jgi:hypothetical protein